MTAQRKLQERIAQMTTKQIKDALDMMNGVPSQMWSQEDLIVETALIFALYNRDEDQWVEAYENRMN